MGYSNKCLEIFSAFIVAIFTTYNAMLLIYINMNEIFDITLIFKNFQPSLDY